MKDLTGKQQFKYKIKKNSGFAIFFYVVIHLAVNIAIWLLELLIGILIGRIIDISKIIESPLFLIINRTGIEVISVYTFVKIFNRKYILIDSKEKFLSKFLIFLIIIVSILMLGTAWHGVKKINSRIYARTVADGILLDCFDKNIEYFNELKKHSPYEKCNTKDEIWSTLQNLLNDIVYEELIEIIINSAVYILVTTISMSYLIKKIEE